MASYEGSQSAVNKPVIVSRVSLYDIVLPEHSTLNQQSQGTLSRSTELQVLCPLLQAHIVLLTKAYSTTLPVVYDMIS
jgi:hypothetical protein